ncbi:MAG: type IV toxin-antitoxin system AbiEi family antitoxin domain-containing protein [Solirubrobacterales bacterium]|nr:type IV toxin-antitoxin system AbiEi family antitoxin domain-containing protein [Solirubrobacterales bacterium]
MAREPDEIHHGGGKHRVDALDVEIARLAARRHGVVAARQLTGIGASSRAIERRVDKSRLHRIHRGVYAVGHDRLTIRGRWMAAVPAGGPGTVLSHRPARSPTRGSRAASPPGRSRSASRRSSAATGSLPLSSTRPSKPRAVAASRTVSGPTRGSSPSCRASPAMPRPTR